MKRRQMILGLALAGTLAAVWWVSGMDEDTDSSSPAHRPRGAMANINSNSNSNSSHTATRRATSRGHAPDASAQSRLLAELTQRQHPHEPLPELTHNPFAAASFDPPPMKVEAPKPSAPPLRYKYLGRILEGDKPTVFLEAGSNMLTVHPGDSLDDGYRVRAISEHSIELEYLPLNQTQTLSF